MGETQSSFRHSSTDDPDDAVADVVRLLGENEQLRCRLTSATMERDAIARRIEELASRYEEMSAAIISALFELERHGDKADSVRILREAVKPK